LSSGSSFLQAVINKLPVMASHFVPSALPTYDIIGLAYEPDIEQCSLYEKSVKGTFSMPTPEERVTTLEYNLDQFNAEATTYYQEMAMQVTMSKGLTEDAVKRLMQLRAYPNNWYAWLPKAFNGVIRIGSKSTGR
jgi:hypothetical protein